MVDLVKIRKKAKKEREKSAETVEPKGSLQEERTPVPTANPVQAETPPPPPSSSKLDRFREEAGKRREETSIAEGAGAGSSAEQAELLTFVIAGEHYAVDIGRIVEIVTPRPITRVPNADPSIVGIISLRGTIVTLLDARRRLRHPPAAGPDEDRRVIVIDQHGETVGFEVDRVLRVAKIDPASLEAHPVVHASELEESIRGVFRHDDALTILLDLDKLLAGSALPQSAA